MPFAVPWQPGAAALISSSVEMRGILLGALLALGPAAAGSAAGTFANPLTAGVLDASATVEWVDGHETPRVDFLDAYNKAHFPNQATWFMAVPGALMGFNGISFGASTRAGPRHLRVGFLADTPVGTVLTRGGPLTRVSVLRPGAAYPGDVARDGDWIEAARTGDGELALWVLPPGTRTRALRFTAELPASPTTDAIRLRGAMILAERLVNLAPRATALVSSHAATAARLTDGSSNEGTAWDNDDAARAGPLSPERPEWVMLVWPRRVSLRGLGVLFAFLGKAEAQIYVGPDDLHPREAGEDRWRTLATPSFPNTYPDALRPVWIDFAREVSTRAVRLRLVAPVADETHYFAGFSRGGKRAWIGEVMALAALGDAAAPPPRPPAAEPRHPPIAVPFTMPEAGFATIVVEDAGGRRVRNLVADTWFPAGPQVAWWDGLDESCRVDGPQRAAHGIYKTVGAPVAPGTYAARGLFHGALALRYEQSVYSPGSPPWMTGATIESGAGGWLADHTSPTAALFLPGPTPRMLLASPVAEAGHGLVWTDLAGRKLEGRRWVGGAWTGASHLARDDGPRAARGVSAYAGVSWQGKLRLTALRDRGEPAPVSSDALAAIDAPALGGLAARDGVLYASLPKSDRLLLVDAASGAVVGEAPLPDGRGLAFDARGRLLALSGRRLLAFDGASPAGGAPRLGPARVVVASGLDDPRALAVDARGDVYVADWGASHQVKVFDAAGRPLRVVGRPGGAAPGLYDPRRMDRPAGLAVASDGRLWVAEDSSAPKRVSVWTTDGAFVTAFYGPPQYGGGGALDPHDRTRFYYAGQGQRSGLEFAIDWAKGTSSLRSIYWLDPSDPLAPPGDTGPETPLYVGGRQYMTEVFNARGVGGPWIANLWLMRGARAVRVASLGLVGSWPLLQTAPFRSRWPAGVDPAKGTGILPGASFIYAWSDLNGDERIQPEEVTIAPDWPMSVTLNDRLEVTTSTATVYAPEGFTDAGVPRYDARHGRRQAGDFTMREVLSGSGTIMALRDGWTFAAGGPVRGFRGGAQRWTYPNEWPSQQAGVRSTRPTHPGELMATTRILGQTLRPVPGKVGGASELVAINGDKGVVFLMTADGLFVSTLFHDVRLARESWNMPEATRGLRLDDVSLGEEDFWTSIAQTDDGAVYVVSGHDHSSLVRVDGLETLRPLAVPSVEVTADGLARAQQLREANELERQRLVGRDLLTIPLEAAGAVTVDGDLGDWPDAAWVDVDGADGPMGRVEAAAAVAGPRLCLAFRTGDAGLLANTGEAWRQLFATGGALDLMLGADPRAAPERAAPAPGDLRLVVTRAAGKTRAVLYRPKAPGARGRPVPFSSPWRTVTMDEVADVSDVVTLAQRGGAYELSVPLATLGLRPRDGLQLRGDVGVLRGDGARTVQRLYWQNKITSTVSDIPTEASLTPALWGRLRFAGKAPATRAPKRVMIQP
jgi:DNA-binding beta-propeller fold protein YncE